MLPCIGNGLLSSRLIRYECCVWSSLSFQFSGGSLFIVVLYWFPIVCRGTKMILFEKLSINNIIKQGIIFPSIFIWNVKLNNVHQKGFQKWVREIMIIIKKMQWPKNLSCEHIEYANNLNFRILTCVIFFFTLVWVSSPHPTPFCLSNLSLPIFMILVPIVTSLILGYMEANILFTRTGQTVFTIFCFQKMLKITILVPQRFYVAYRILLVMFCVLKFYFVDFNGTFTSSPTWRLKMHVLCKVGKNIIFQNKTLL